jgi:hypothetical protein
MDEDVDGETPAPPTARHRRPTRALYAVGGAVGIALIGATASALITPERIDAFFGAFGDHSGPTPTASAATVEYKTVVSNDRSITVDIPTEWGANLARWDVSQYPGSALRTGIDTSDLVDFAEDGGYLAASAATAVAAGAPAMSSAERRDWLRSYVELDWTIEGCVRQPDPVWERSGWTIEATRWKDCAAYRGERYFEFAATDEDGDVLVIAQVSLSDGTPDAVAERYVESFVVDLDKLPAPSTDDYILP